MKKWMLLAFVGISGLCVLNGCGEDEDSLLASPQDTVTVTVNSVDTVTMTNTVTKLDTLFVDKEIVVTKTVTVDSIITTTDTITVEKTATDTIFQELIVPKNPLKYVFLLIGDGMADPQINITQQALNNPNFLPKHTVREIGFTKFPVNGSMTTYAEDRYITGSAAAATAMSTGSKTTIGTIALSGDHADTIETIVEKIVAQKTGWRTGVVSSVSIDHATPAAFYSHATSRGLYYDIAAQMATSGVDFFAGGAKGDRDKYKDGRTDIPTLMEDAGYTIVDSKAGLESITNGQKVWCYGANLDWYGAYSMMYDIDRTDDDASLADFTEAAINNLDNENGFFLMVEGGKIDWACHANDVVSQTSDMIDFNNAVEKAIAFAAEHPDETLIITTGDHETGGLTVGYAATGYESYFEILAHQTNSYEMFDKNLDATIEANGDTITFAEVLEEVKATFGLGDIDKDTMLALSAYDTTLLYNSYLSQITDDEEVYNDEESFLRYGGYHPISMTATHLLNNKAGLGWTSYKHTAVPVPVYVSGNGQEEFDGMYDNTDLAKKILTLLELQ